MTRFSPSPGVHAAADRDGAVLLHVPHGLLYGLNPTAAVLWERISQGAELHSLAETLAGQWGVNAGKLHTDALALTGELSRLGLVTPVEEKQ